MIKHPPREYEGKQQMIKKKVMIMKIINQVPFMWDMPKAKHDTKWMWGGLIDKEMNKNKIRQFHKTCKFMWNHILAI